MKDRLTLERERAFLVRCLQRACTSHLRVVRDGRDSILEALRANARALDALDGVKGKS